MKIDTTKLQPFIDSGDITVQKHPTADLYIYNYSHACQWRKNWTAETMMCRGLILDAEGNVIARPFSKFFNLEEYIAMGQELPNEPFKVYDKLDGSLGIAYWDGEKVAIATRGSFVSEQAIKATQILNTKYKDFDFGFFVDKNPGWTYLFEIVFPQNRIVVDYGNIEDIFLLAVVHNGDPKIEFTLKEQELLPFPKVKVYDGITNLKEIKEISRSNAEGFVVRFESGLRVKIKYDEYVRLHRLITGISAKRVWERLVNNEPIEELLEQVPDEFYDWVNITVDKIMDNYTKIEQDGLYAFNQVKDMPTRKEQALFLKEYSRQAGIAFCMLDKKDYKDLIWPQVKPVAERPFREDIDA